MDCRDRKIQELIFDYVDGGLEAAGRTQVEQHLSVCDDCRELEREYRTAIGAARAHFREFAHSHIGNEILVDYVDNPKDLSASQHKTVELHLELCAACREKVDMLKRVGAQPSTAVRRSRSAGLRDWLQQMLVLPTRRPAVAVASAIVLLVLAIPLGYVIKSQLTGGPRLEFVQSADVIWLRELYRDDADKPQLEETDGWLALGMAFEPFFDEETYRLTLQSAGDEILIDRALAESDFMPGGRLSVRIRTRSLQPGEYTLVITGSQPTTRREVSRTMYPFVLSRE